MTTFTLPSLLFLFSLLSVANSGSIGINYGRIANNLPSPSQVVQLLKTQGINRVKLYDTDSTVLTALSGTNISVTVALPNEQLSDAASKQSFTDSWVQSNILPYYPKTVIESIAVGNEVFVDPKNTTPFLLPAMKNVYSSLVKYNIASSIKVSSPVALSALQNSYPSSAGSFKTELTEPVIKPMLSFLKQTGSYLMVNIYPFFAYADNTDTISLDYALFQDNKGPFEAQIDAVYAAMKTLNFDHVPMVISETGWPSKGDENEAGASAANAAAYNGNLVRRVLTGSGTPLKPDEPLNVYLFALFNENKKPGPTSERNYGLFYPNEKKVYDIRLTSEGLDNGPIMNNGSKNQVTVTTPSPSPLPAPVNGGKVEESKLVNTWCVANEKAAPEKLQAALDYACGEGGADCHPIQPGATCYDPDTLEAHASYAFNSYYQKKSRGPGTCGFDGVAYVVTQHPKYGSCKFPTGY
ncbi:unnamed protein product [Withania somnifera]